MRVVTFPKELMLPILNGEENSIGTVIEDTLVEHDNWSVHHMIIFKTNYGKFYRTWYRVPSIDSDGKVSWEAEDEVECVEVKPVKQLETVYVAI